MSSRDVNAPPHNRPPQPHHSSSTSSTDFASLDQRPGKSSSAGDGAQPTEDAPAANPSSRPDRRPPLPQQSLSAASTAPSNAPSTAPSRASTTGKARKKPERPRPANLAGPTLARVPESFRMQRSDSDRSTGSVHSGAGVGGVVGGSFCSPSLSGDEAAKSDGGVAKKLWAIGGVFPKHENKRRRSSVVREWGVRKGSLPSQDSGSDGGAVGPQARDGRPKLPHVLERGASIDATVSDSTGPEDAASETRSTRSTRSARRRDRAGTGDGVGDARTDPFEDLQRSGSQRPRKASDALLGTTASAVGAEAHQAKQALRKEVGDEVEARLQKVQSAGSRTVAAEDGQTNEKDEQDERGGKGERGGADGETPEGAEAGRGGPNVGGELDQSAEQWAEDVEDPDDLPVRNWWGTVRYALREPLAEFLGTLVLICIGIGGDCQTKISQETMGAYQSMNWAWGFGVMIALYIAGGISGGHTNPAVTITLAIFRGFPWKMVPRYILAQVLGAYCGALIIYGNYRRAIHEYDPYKLIEATDFSNASAPLFITAPSVGVSSTLEGFCQEILAGGILSIAVLALGDENNAPPGAGLGAIVLGFVVVAIGMSNGWISGYAINPARDFGPRLALWTLGYGIKLWHDAHWWWLIGPILGPLVGSLAGALAYDLCIFTGPGSPVNFSGSEIAGAVGLHSIHNMVWIALSPQKRRERRFARNPRSEDDLAENGLATKLARRRDAQVLPGRSTEKDKRELRLNRRWRKGKEKVIRQEERSRQRERSAMKEYRQSLERARKQEAHGESPDAPAL